MNRYLILLLLLVSNSLLAQDDVLRFQAHLNTKNGRPLSGVLIKINGLGSAKTDGSGFLIYDDIEQTFKKKSGDNVRISAEFSGYKVVNFYDFTEYRIPNDRSKIIDVIMSKPNDLSNYNHFHYRDVLVGQAQYKTKPNKTINENQQNTLNELALLLSDSYKIENDKMLFEAMNHVAKGNFNEAQEVLNSQEIIKQGDRAREIQHMSSKLIGPYKKKVLDSASENRRAFIKKSLIKASIYRFKNSVDEASIWYKHAYIADTNYAQTLLFYADFLKDQAVINLPETYLLRALKSNNDLYMKGLISNVLGIYYNWSRDQQSSIRYFEDAREQYLILPFQGSLLIKEALAGVSNNLANSLRDGGPNIDVEKNYEKVLNLHKSSLAMFRELSNVNPIQYQNEVAKVLYSMGITYRKHGEYEKAKESYKDAMKEYLKTDEKDNFQFKVDIAETLSSLGAAYLENKEVDIAVDTLKSSLKIFKELVKENPERFSQNVAFDLNLLGIAYTHLSDTINAQLCYEDALNRYLKISSKNHKFKLELAEVLLNYSLFNIAIGKEVEAEKYCRESLSNYIYLVSNSKDNWQRTVYINKGMNCFKVYRDLIENEDDISKQRKSLDVYIIFFGFVNNSAEKRLTVYEGYAFTCLLTKGYKEAEIYSKKVLAINSTEVYSKLILSYSLILQNKWPDAKRIYESIKKSSKRIENDYGMFLSLLNLLNDRGINHSDFEKANNMFK